MPSAANGKSEKPASSEATDNSPIRQITTVLEHKIRNLEKRKSKLTSYRDLQKAGKELKSDQKVAVAKYEEVAQTLEFARELAKQVNGIVTVAEREAKKQAKKEAWVRYASDTNKIREVLLILDCLTHMGNPDAREDFIRGTNGAAKLTEQDLKILDDLYPEVTPTHDLTEEGLPGFSISTTKAAEHLYSIIDGKPKDVLGTTYAHIKEIVTSVHECGYFDKKAVTMAPDNMDGAGVGEEVVQENAEEGTEQPEEAPLYGLPPPGVLPAPPAPQAVPAPGYPLCPLPPITLQEVEHAYFAQQYPQQRPITEVIGSQNFFFLQESEIDSPAGTPQPPPIMNQPSPPGPIPSQTFTNQHFVQLPAGCVPEPGSIPLPPQPHFPPHPDHAAYAAVPLQPPAPIPVVHPPPAAPAPAPLHHSGPQLVQHATPQPATEQALASQPDSLTPKEDKKEEWKESRSPERDEMGDRKSHGQGDAQNRFRRYGGRGGGRGTSNGYRGRGAFQSRQGSDYHSARHQGEYQGRSGKDYPNRQYNDNYQSRHSKDGYQNRGNNDGYYGNGDIDSQQNENGGRDRDRYNDNGNYQGGYKGRGRNASRGGGGTGGSRGAPRSARPPHFNRKPENVE